MASQNRPKTELPATSLAAPAGEAAGAATAQKRAKAKEPAREEIEALAYRYWEEGGRREGSGEENWKRAEAELKSRKR